VFEVSAGKLLDFLVSTQGIEANPKKIKAIKEMWPSGSPILQDAAEVRTFGLD
jgi:hypothetical protein